MTKDYTKIELPNGKVIEMPDFQIHRTDNQRVADDYFQRAIHLQRAMTGASDAHLDWLHKESMREFYEQTVEQYDRWNSRKSSDYRPDLHRLEKSSNFQERCAKEIAMMLDSLPKLPKIETFEEFCKRKNSEYLHRSHSNPQIYQNAVVNQNVASFTHETVIHEKTQKMHQPKVTCRSST